MNKRKQFLWVVLGSMMLAGLTACSGNDDATDVPDDGVKARRMTITETDGAAARQVLTRAILTEADGLSASWTTGDGLTYCNLTHTHLSTEEVYSGPLTATSTDAQRTALSAECRQVVEEPTKRGFRVKLII
jgi:hypothetical protein